MPLDPDAILRIWRAIKPFAFHTTYGMMVDSMVVRDGDRGSGGGEGRMGVKEKILESAKIAVRRMEWGERGHAVLVETVD
jgi:hypothetical protein